MNKLDKVMRYLDIFCLVFWFLETVYASVCVVGGDTRYNLFHVITFFTLTIVECRVCLLERYLDKLFDRNKDQKGKSENNAE